MTDAAGYFGNKVFFGKEAAMRTSEDVREAGLYASSCCEENDFW
jgi:hypothetical protein